MTTIAHAAEVLEVSPRRVRQFVEEGRLRAELINPRLYLVNMDDVEKLAKVTRKAGRPSQTSKKSRRAG